jgi:RNA polymerase primary sigma factor
VVDESDRVRAQLVEANLRLVVAIAKGYLRYGATLLDLVQDGNSGILKAAEKFDPNRGVPFGAYAGWWIRSSIRRGVPGQVGVIRLPEKSWLQLLRLRKSAAELWHVLGRPPRPSEIAAAAGVMAREAVTLLAFDAPPLSLEAAYADDDTSPSESLRAPSTEWAAADADRRLLAGRVARALATLNAQQRRVMELRFGLVDGQRRTLAEVGRVLEISGEWVRKLEARALEQLRQPSCRARLEAFLD